MNRPNTTAPTLAETIARQGGVTADLLLVLVEVERRTATTERRAIERGTDRRDSQ